MSVKRKILIVEDELLIAKVMGMQIERLGNPVRFATEEKEAVRLAVEWQPDLIVMDVYLKNSSCGIQAAQQIRANGSNALIVFTTGNSIESTENRIKDMKLCKLFSKPIDFNQIASLITAE